MEHRHQDTAGWRKLAASVVVAACAVLGVIGIVLPIVPGVLFLALAAFVAARHFPWIGARLRAHHTLGRHFRTADPLRELPLAEQARLFGWYCLKMIGEGLMVIASAVAKATRR
jgi:uncharacterized membrane protein YbaN (DUF454 family)